MFLKSSLLSGTVIVAVAAGSSPLAGEPGTVTHGTTTVYRKDIPENAAAYWPWSSKKDFFSNSGLSWREMSDAGELRCSSSEPGAKVFTVSDGEHDRCFVAVKSENLTTAAPVLFFSHGSGGSAANCGEGVDEHGNTWVKMALRHNFVFVCGEAVIKSVTNNITGAPMQGGIWDIPEVFNDTSSRQCEADSGSEAAYMKAVWEAMDAKPNEFNTSASFHIGCSEGSAFSQWAAVCRHESDPQKISAFTTHSTGLKVKGDGNTLPPCYRDPTYTWGECPTCKYWPTVPGKFEGLKACINDNTADPSTTDPFFYRTSVQMAKYYEQFGSRYNTTFLSGGHCKQHSFAEMADCLDDNTGRLLGPKGQCTDIPPDDKETCSQQAAAGKCVKPWMNGYCCKTCFDCDASCAN
jgi:hypothetical protein